MRNLLLVMLGGALGSAARFGVGRLTLQQFGPHYPWGTLIVNLVGGFAMGLLAGLLARFGQGAEGYRYLIGIGLLGGFTTFSAFSLDAANMIERGALAGATIYALVSVIGSIVALFAGLWMVRAFA
ncbi:fluoride efflux transporter CrcB [Sphingomonas cavernae]|uniref:Fluoride-specific ion channel FluC n=1 Tax=Sphingomonas cavernae TaxID=2320861 RepID=A0A418WRU4_9SPHN|nr:fluoride efflux transporter CrcB [Sphingomonas cavernae]RJF93916.1 fluoride efflux transporter CrcB [Sphingomonas cavernae]